MKNKIRSAKKITARQQKLSFGSQSEEEFVSSISVYDENGNILEESKSDDEDGGEEKHIYTYDDSGRLVKHEHHMLNDDVCEIMVYTRDEKGRLTTEQKLYGDDPGEKSEYEYLAHQHPVKIKRFDSDGEPESVEELIYDDKDRLVEHHSWNPDGILSEKTAIAYNDKGLAIEKKVWNVDGEIVKIVDITYNDDGDVLRITEKNENGKVVSDILSVYDDRRNVIERKIRDYQSRTLRFTYDENNNCIAEEVFDEHGNLIRKNSYEFDENNILIGESALYVDSMRGGNFNNSRSRYEYEFHS